VSEKHEYKLMVRLTKTEYEFICRLARVCGSKSAVIREALHFFMHFINAIPDVLNRLHMQTQSKREEHKNMRE